MEIQQDNTKISVIVPVYRAEPYLRQCIDSLLAQTYSDFELILVDDGSPDKSGAICDEYAQKDCRVQVIHKPNGGVSSARNTGLDAATGRFVVFADSDDYVGSGYLSGLLETFRESGANLKTLVISDYQPFCSKWEEARSFPEPFTAELDQGTAEPQVFRDLAFGFRIFPPYCKLYSRELIETEHIRFDTGLRTAEDFDFNLRYINHTEKILYVPNVQYYYRLGEYVGSAGSRGSFGNSEVRSAHIMAHGMTELAKRLGVYNDVHEELCLWAANKHYFNRLRMLFAAAGVLSIAERRKYYRALVSDRLYRGLYRRGIRRSENSTTRRIGVFCDCFFAWELFYALLRFQIRKKK